jgi:rhodanese-related sulfurtransferase
MEDITVQELKTRLDNGEMPVIIDVRETWENEEFNIGGTLIPLGDLPGKLEDFEDLKDTEIIVHCRSGNRSGTAKAFMTAQGFTKVRNLLGGMLDWQREFGV